MDKKDYSRRVSTVIGANAALAKETLHTFMQTNPEMIQQMVPPPATPEETGKVLAAFYFSFLEAVSTGKVE